MARKLMQWAKDRDWESIEAGSFEDIPLLYEHTGNAGRSFWEKLGFCLVSTEPEPAFQQENEFVRKARQQAGALVQIVQKSETGRGGGAPQLLLLAPPPVAKLTGFAEMFEGAERKSRRFADHYARVGQERGCVFLDTGQVIVSSDLDCGRSGR